MASTLDDLEKVLTSRGYPARKILDRHVLTRVPTTAYVNAAGVRTIDVQLAFDRENGCLTIDTPWAFDSRLAAHKEAMLACLLAASAKSPLVKTQLDPDDGEVRLRVDCRCGSDGVADDDVVQMLSLLPSFADRWYPQIKSAMEKGSFDPAGGLPSARAAKLESIAKRAGGVNRLAALLRMRYGDGGGRGPDASP